MSSVVRNRKDLIFKTDENRIHFDIQFTVNKNLPSKYHEKRLDFLSRFMSVAIKISQPMRKIDGLYATETDQELFLSLRYLKIEFLSNL